MSGKLVAEEGSLQGLTLSFEGEGEQWVIGRDPEGCDLVIEDSTVSRRHLLCKKTASGILIENLSVTNPAKLNDEELTGPEILVEGDRLAIGDAVFYFYKSSLESVPKESLEEDKKEIKNKATREASYTEELGMNPDKTNRLVEELEGVERDTIFDEERTPGSSRESLLAEVNFDLTDGSRWLLKVVGGPNHGAEFSMQPGMSYVIGTDPNLSDIVFHDTSISRQHARISVTADELVMIEDLKSRNGTLVDGEPLTHKIPLKSNILVTMGTTSFFIFDREGEVHTIISPFLPSIVKVLQKEEQEKESKESAKEEKKDEHAGKEAEPLETHHEPQHHFGQFILIGMIVGLFVIVGIGTTTLFKSEPVANKVEAEDLSRTVAGVLKGFPTLNPYMSPTTGKLMLVGHVLTANDRSKLLYALDGVPGIKGIDDSGIVVDEFVWQEANQILNKVPGWKGVTIYADTPGHFILSGYLQSRQQAERLSEYISSNFSFFDRLERRIIVEEDIISSVNSSLSQIGLRAVKVQMNEGELSLTGGVPDAKRQEFNALLKEFAAIPGVRDVRNLVTNQPPEASMINISDRYSVSGFTHQAGKNTSVVIDGHILYQGDYLDGMRIESIDDRTIMLEKDGVKYRIDYSH